MLKRKCIDRPMSVPSLVKLGPHTPENHPVEVSHRLKLHGEYVLNRQELGRGLFDFALKETDTIIINTNIHITPT